MRCGEHVLQAPQLARVAYGAEQTEQHLPIERLRGMRLHVGDRRPHHRLESVGQFQPGSGVLGREVLELLRGAVGVLPDPQRATVRSKLYVRGVDGDLAQAVLGQLQVLRDTREPEDPGQLDRTFVEVVPGCGGQRRVGRGHPAYGQRDLLHHHHLQAFAGQVAGSGQSVVTRSDDDHIRVTDADGGFFAGGTVRLGRHGHIIAQTRIISQI